MTPAEEELIAMLVKELLLGNMFVLDDLRAMQIRVRDAQVLEPRDLRRHDFFAAAIDLALNVKNPPQDGPLRSRSYDSLIHGKAKMLADRLAAIVALGEYELPNPIPDMVRAFDRKVPAFFRIYRRMVGLRK